MIVFEKFIQAIHNAVLTANVALQKKNEDIIKDYFEDADGAEDLQKSLNEALEATTEVLEQDRPDAELYEKAEDSLTKAKKALQGKSDPDDMVAQSFGSLQPKTVSIQYPDQTKDGLIHREVKVPLITLVPLSMSQVTEVKLHAELEVTVDSSTDELMVSFPVNVPAGEDGVKDDADKSKSNLATIDITIQPHRGTPGLRKLVEGYEKVLRAQIPH